MKFAQRIIAILLTISTIVLMTGCQKTTNDNETSTLDVVLGSEPATLDPAISLTIDIRSYLSHLFEGLTVLNESGSVKPGIAELWTSNEDMTEYTFTIRDTAVWTDGKKVSAQDFKYAWLRVLNPETASGWASFLYYIKGAEEYNQGLISEESVGITVVDENTLHVELESACSFFAAMVAMQPYYPVRQDIIEKNGNDWAFNPDLFVSNGVYELKEWNHDESIVMSKSDTYWGSVNGSFNTINFLLVEDSSTVMNLYETGDVDFVEKVLTSSEMEQVGKIQSCDFTVTKFLSINSKRNTFSDVRVREAISIALNRDNIAKLMGTGYIALCSWVPYGFADDNGKDFRDQIDKTYVSSSSDLERARALMTEAGFPDGEGFPAIDYLTNTSSLNVTLAEIVKEQLSQLGIQVNVITYESKVFNEYRANRNFDIVAASWAAEYPDISSYFYGFQSADINNYASFNNKKYDKLYDKALTLSSISERYALYHKQEELIMNSWYILPLYAENTSYIANDRLSGYIHDVTGCLNFNNAIQN